MGGALACFRGGAALFSAALAHAPVPGPLAHAPRSDLLLAGMCSLELHAYTVDSLQAAGGCKCEGGTGEMAGEQTSLRVKKRPALLFSRFPLPASCLPLPLPARCAHGRVGERRAAGLAPAPGRGRAQHLLQALARGSGSRGRRSGP